jgi:sorbitol/mannitol transport system substrate-binding protein
VKGSHWLWSWALAVPKASRHKEQAQRFAAWATSREYIALVASKQGWAAVPSGTRESTYQEPQYQQAAPFADFVFNAIKNADPTDATVDKVPYTGVQFVTIPQFQSIGTLVARDMADVLTGKSDIASALRNSQASTDKAMRRAGYYQ